MNLFNQGYNYCFSSEALPNLQFQKCEAVGGNNAAFQQHQPQNNFCPIGSLQAPNFELNPANGGGIGIESFCDPQSEYDDYDTKSVAYKRFKRNDYLMKKIVSPVIVSSTLPVMESKLIVMRRQVEALQMCIEKENEEIAEVRKRNAAALEDYSTKKAEFDQTYKKLSRPISDAQITKFSNYIYNRLQSRRLERLNAQLQDQQVQNAPSEEQQN